MLRRLWFHRDMEQLQNRITAYLFSTSKYWPQQERSEIQYEWNKIQKEVNETLSEMDREVFSQMSQQIHRTCASNLKHPLS